MVTKSSSTTDRNKVRKGGGVSVLKGDYDNLLIIQPTIQSIKFKEGSILNTRMRLQIETNGWLLTLEFLHEATLCIKIQKIQKGRMKTSKWKE